MYKINPKNEEGRPNLLVFSQSKENLASIPYFYTGMIQPFFKSLNSNFNTYYCSSYENDIISILNNKPDFIIIDAGHDRFPNTLPSIEIISKIRESIPVAFYTAMDAHCLRISENIKYLNRLKPDVIFSHDFINMTYPKNFSDKHIYIMNSYDDDIHKEYHLEKEILCGFYGDGFFTRNAYPWRRKIAARVLPEFPSYHLPRPVGLRDHGISASQYAKVVNKTKIVFGCGGIKDLPVRKLFEIPAAGALLMLPKTENTEKIGFRDKINCIFVDETNVLQNIRFLLDNPLKYDEIRNNGQEFVNNNHSWKSRPHVYEWFKLFKIKDDNQKIIQKDLIGNLELINKKEDVPILNQSPIDQWLKDAGLFLNSRKFHSALENYEQILAHLEYLPEAIYGMSICKIFISGEKDPRMVRFLEIFKDRIDFENNELSSTLKLYYYNKISKNSALEFLRKIRNENIFSRLEIH